MYCPNCGSKLDDDAKFCTSCGYNIDDAKENNDSNDYNTHSDKKDYRQVNNQDLEDNKTEKIVIPNGNKNTNENRQTITSDDKDSTQSVSLSKGTLKKVGLAVLILAIALFGYRTWSNRPVQIALSDYYNVSFQGADGYGQLDYEFDESKFVNENKDKIKLNYPEAGGRIPNPISLSTDLANSIDFNTEVFVEPEENLSNGDEVTLNFNNDSLDIENYYNVKIKNDSKKVVVDGLKEVKEVNPADYYEVEVEGVSPNASLNIVKKENAPEYLENVRAYADQSNILSSGEEVEIKFEYDENYLIENYGVVISPNTIKVTIDGIASYVSSYDELSDEDKKELEEEAGYQIDDQVKKWTEADLSKKELIGTVTISPKDSGGYFSSYNNVYLIYGITATENIPEKDYKYDFSYYTYIRFDDVLNSEDDDLYKEVKASNKSLRHRAAVEAGKNESIYYSGYYFMEELMNDIYNSYDQDSYNYEISFDLDEYRVETDGVAGDYQSDRGPLLRLDEDGNAYYIQYGEEALEGTWEGDGENFKLSLRGINNASALSGIVTESKKIRIPDQEGWSGEVFTKMY